MTKTIEPMPVDTAESIARLIRRAMSPTEKDETRLIACNMVRFLLGAYADPITASRIATALTGLVRESTG